MKNNLRLLKFHYLHSLQGVCLDSPASIKEITLLKIVILNYSFSRKKVGKKIKIWEASK